MSTSKKTIDPFSISNNGIIMGQIIDSFTLSSQTPDIKNKGYIAAEYLLFWSLPYLDFNDKTKLYLRLHKNTLHHKVQLTLKIASLFYGSIPSSDSNILIDFDTNSGSMNRSKIKVPFETLNFKEFYVQSTKAYAYDYADITLTFPNYQDIVFDSIKIDIFHPFQMNIPK